MRRLAVLLAGLAAFAAAGIGTFVALHEDGQTLGPVQCGNFDILETYCIPGIAGDDVIAVLRNQGFACTLGRFCELGVGNARYDVEIISHEDVDDLIADFSVDVHYDAATDLGVRSMALLEWFVTLPFADDPEANEVSREWLAENVGGSDEVTIRGFDLSLTSPQEGHLRLSFAGIGDPGPPIVDGEEVEMDRG